MSAGQLAVVAADIAAVREVCGAIPLKVILATSLTDEAQTVKICEICRDLLVVLPKALPDSVMADARTEEVALMKASAAGPVAVKAFAAVRDWQTAL